MPKQRRKLVQSTNTEEVDYDHCHSFAEKEAINSFVCNTVIAFQLTIVNKSFIEKVCEDILKWLNTTSFAFSGMLCFEEGEESTCFKFEQKNQ